MKLVDLNVLSQNVSCCKEDQQLLCPAENILCQIAHDSGNSTSVSFMYATTVAFVTHQDHRPSHDSMLEGIQSQLDSLYLQNTDMKILFFLHPHPSSTQILQIHTPSHSSTHLCTKGKIEGGLLERDTGCPSPVITT